MTDKLFYIVNETGMRVDAKILSKFKLNNKNFIAYTFNEINDEGMIKIYVNGIVNSNGVYYGNEITDDNEWNEIKNVLKTLARSEEEQFPASIKSDYKIIGEEVESVRPKKLLVSKKFTDVLESKYSEKENKPEPEIVIPIINEEKEAEMEKTIKIPTFEELQARNKTIQAVRETAMETPKEEEKVVPFKPVEEPKKEEPAPAHSYESRYKKSDYEEKYKKDVEPVLLDVFAKQQKQIEALEEELSKTKFDLFEKQKEALSLSNEKDQYEKKSHELEQQLSGVQAKMNGILSVLQGEK